MKGPGQAGPARIISGGQTGADRAALDVAIALGIPYGGRCPQGGWAEDFPDPPGLLADYPDLRETPTADTAQRTAWNARDSDASLILAPAAAAGSPGTDLTVQTATGLNRPFTRIDPLGRNARSEASAFIDALPPNATLNIAGTRESEAPGIYEAARTLLLTVLRPSS